MTRVRGVLLDVDGTLVDSNMAHARAWVDALGEAGFTVTKEAAWRCIGMGGDKLIPALVGIDGESAQAEAIGARRTEIFRERYLATVTPFPEVRELLLRFREEGLKLVVASSAKADELGSLLAIAGVRDLLEGATSADDAARSKPDPDIIVEAVKRAGEGAASLVLLGDTPYDVEAGRRAGVRVVAVRCSGWGDDELRGAAAVYDGASELLRRFATSVFAGGVQGATSPP